MVFPFGKSSRCGVERDRGCETCHMPKLSTDAYGRHIKSLHSFVLLPLITFATFWYRYIQSCRPRGQHYYPYPAPSSSLAGIANVVRLLSRKAPFFRHKSLEIERRQPLRAVPPHGSRKDQELQVNDRMSTLLNACHKRRLRSIYASRSLKVRRQSSYALLATSSTSKSSAG